MSIKLQFVLVIVCFTPSLTNLLAKHSHDLDTNAIQSLSSLTWEHWGDTEGKVLLELEMTSKVVVDGGLLDDDNALKILKEIIENNKGFIFFLL